MPLLVRQGSQGVEAIDTVPSLNEEDATSITPTAFLELPEGLQLTAIMENQGIEMEPQETAVETVVEELVQTELGAQEIEIESETPTSQATEEATTPKIMATTASVVAKPKTVPPLRPLTIAPKPEKIPIALKGQQLLLVQGASGTQQIKLLSTQGQEISLANLSLGRPVTLKQGVKTVTATAAGGNIVSAVQPKQVVMKKVITQVPKNVVLKSGIATKQGQVMVVQQKSEPQIKVVQGAAAATLANTKTITLQQAQDLGLIAGGKVISAQSSGTKHIILNKGTAKTIKIIPQTKSQTKILPAPQTSTTVVNKVPQRIILKPTNTAGGTATVLASNQILQVTGGQSLPAGLHQINIPGKGVQFIKFVNTSATTEATATSVGNLNTGTAKAVLTPSPVTLKTANVVLSDVKPRPTVSGIAPKPMNSTLTRANVHINNTPTGQVVMLPGGYIHTTQTSSNKIPIPIRSSPVKPLSEHVVPESNLESNGMRPRKPCNCMKSQCLKLYCDCFANGEFCHMCNCMNCFNNLENEEHRQRAIKNCLERNPNAFRPKIGKAKNNTDDAPVRKHTKGCNCKRSGCLKNYCECYEAKIACSSNCKCLGCKNVEDSIEKKCLRPQSVPEEAAFNGPSASAKLTASIRDSTLRPRRSSNSKQAFSFITNDVIEATANCLLTLSEQGENNNADDSTEATKKLIIEEFGRCLMEIIDCSMTATT